MKKWSLNSWRNFPAKHLPDYQDKKELDLVLGKIKKYPPLVFAGESRSLKKSLKQVVEGKAFFLSIFMLKICFLLILILFNKYFFTILKLEKFDF